MTLVNQSLKHKISLDESSRPLIYCQAKAGQNLLLGQQKLHQGINLGITQACRYRRRHDPWNGPLDIRRHKGLRISDRLDYVVLGRHSRLTSGRVGADMSQIGAKQTGG